MNAKQSLRLSKCSRTVTYPLMDSSKSYINREPTTLVGRVRLDRDWIFDRQVSLAYTTTFLCIFYFNLSLNLYRVQSYIFVVPNWLHINWLRGFETTYSHKSRASPPPVDSYINWRRRFETTYSRKNKEKKQLIHILIDDEDSRLRTHAKAKKKKTTVDSHINWRQRFVITYSRKSKKSQLIHISTGERGFKTTHSQKNPSWFTHQLTNKDSSLRTHVKFYWIYTSNVELDKRGFQT